MNIVNLLPLLKIGVIKVQSAGEAVSSLNNTLKAVGTVIGGIIILVAAIKMVTALAGEDSRSRSESTILLSVGVLFISISNVLTSLGVDNISGSTSAQTVGGNIAQVIGTMVTYAGGILALFSVFTMILAVANENSEGYINGSKMLGMAVGFLMCGSLGTTIKSLIVSKTTDANSYINIASNFLTSIATYIGAGLVIAGIFKLIASVREENSKDKDTAIKFLVSGIGLLGIRTLAWAIGL